MHTPLPLLLPVLLFLTGCALVDDDKASVPVHTVAPDTLRIVLNETGEVQAADGEQIVAPNVHGRLKIVHLWPEGAEAEIGDLLIQFEGADLEQEVSEEEDRLKQAMADLDKALAIQQQRLADMESAIEDRDAALELAKVNLQKAQYGSPIEKQEAEIQLNQARLALQQARHNLKAQKIANKVELDKHNLHITRRRERYEGALSEYESLKVRASRPGIVVYESIWKGNKREKIRVGDEVRRRNSLMMLPDLSQMQVISQLGEVDGKKVSPGQKVLIRLEAFPGPVFHGRVSKLSPIANPHPDAFNVKVFELLVDIDEQDERLKPGMTTRIEIVIDEQPEVLTVPLAALFEREGDPVVYRLKGNSFESVDVELGARSTTQAAIISGLAAGDQVALADPNL